MPGGASWAGRIFPGLTLLFVPAIIGGCITVEAPSYPGDLGNRGDRHSFIVVGDTQRTSAWEFWRERHDEVGPQLWKQVAVEDPAFVLILGDLVFRGASDSQWARFDDATEPARRMGIPFLAVLGNHDLYGRREQALRNFHSRFSPPDRRGWYGVRYQGAGIVVLNSNFGMLGPRERDEQAAWFQETLDEWDADPDVHCVFVSCHHPPFTNSTVVSGNRAVQEEFVEPYLRSRKARVLFSGHSHAYERFRIRGKTFIVSGGGGGPRHRLRERPPGEALHDLGGGANPRPFHYCRVEWEGTEVRLRMVRLDPATGDWSTGEEVVLAE